MKYVVVGTAYEYNDEYYDSVKDGVEVIPKVYNTKEDALKARDLLLLSLPSDYWSDYNWFPNLSESGRQFVITHGQDPSRRYDWHFRFTTPEEVVKAHKHFGWPLAYRVIELEEN